MAIGQNWNICGWVVIAVWVEGCEICDDGVGVLGGFGWGKLRVLQLGM